MKLPALHGFVSWAVFCTSRHCTWRANNPIAWRCTDLLVNPQSKDLHRKRASGLPISRICTVQHGRSLFIWILSWHCVWSSVQHDAAHDKPPCKDLHETAQSHRCTDLQGRRATGSSNARNCTDSMQLPCGFHVDARHCTAVS